MRNTKRIAIQIIKTSIAYLASPYWAAAPLGVLPKFCNKTKGVRRTRNHLHAFVINAKILTRWSK